MDDGTFGKHLPPQPGKSHPSDRARGDTEWIGQDYRSELTIDTRMKSSLLSFMCLWRTQHTWVYTGGSSVSAQIGAVKAGKVNQGRAVNSVQASTS